MANKNRGGIFVMAALAILVLSYANLNALLIPVLFYISIIVLMSWQGIALTQGGVPTYKMLVGPFPYFFYRMDFWL